MTNLFLQNFSTISKNIQQNCSITLDESINGFKVTMSAAAGTARLSNLGFNGYKGNVCFIADVSATANVTTSVDICDVGNVGYSVTTTPTRIQLVANAQSYTTASSYNGFLDNYISGASSGVVVTFANVKIMLVESGSVLSDITKAGLIKSEDFTENAIGASISKYGGVYARDFVEW